MKRRYSLLTPEQEHCFFIEDQVLKIQAIVATISNTYSRRMITEQQWLAEVVREVVLDVIRRLPPIDNGGLS